ncbi:antibacterial peptide PMAP-37-like isoform X4 [Camelus ferus]|uniref:Antibacterial peptide PMAP-37-like isoform X4 n=1 Tax=Camelus ferus TaxID=419612 RepID=A0A8B8R941_CAMFR|nr:antibacterial peptide PMAP-37-like isoform X4 [Camelus ferus]
MAAIAGYSLTKRPLGQHPDCDTRLHRSPSLLPSRRDEDLDAPKPVSFTVKETVCPRRTQLPPEQCDFKENGVVKQCLGTVNLYQLRDNFDITCNELQSVGLFGRIRDSIRKRVNRVRDAIGKVIGYVGDKIRPG